MSRELADWLSALDREGCRPRKSGDGWSARCPSHDDRNPSLSVSEGDTQEVVVHCFAGCGFEDIRDALGLDRWDARPAGLQVVKSAPAKNRDRKPRQLPNGPGEQSWIYTDAAGAPLMAAVRRDCTGQDGKPGKKVWQWTPKGDGWIPIGMPEGKPKPLYGLPELAAEPEGRVVVVEGEKCVDAWRSVWPERLVTTWPGGCDQWHLADWTVLPGREVAILADADQGGRDAAQGIAGLLHSLGCTVQVALPEGDTGEDVADWIAADGADATLERIEGLLEDYRPGPEAAGRLPAELTGAADSERDRRQLVGAEGALEIARAGLELAREHEKALSLLIRPVRERLGAGTGAAVLLAGALPAAAGAADDVGALEVFRAAAVGRPPLPEPLTGEGWAEVPPERVWLVEGWLPAGELSMLAGAGSSGKSLLLLQLAVALACERAVLGYGRGVVCSGNWLPAGDGSRASAPRLCDEPLTVVVAGWEDSRGEALRRRRRLTELGGCAWAGDDSIDGRLHVLPMRGHGPAWAPAQGGSGHIATVGELTKTGRELRDYCQRVEARLLVLDPSSLALALEENNRALVSLALEDWAGWASESGCAVVLTAHAAKAREGEGADYSGSTAWRGLVRALWTLRQPERDKDVTVTRSPRGRATPTGPSALPGSR